MVQFQLIIKRISAAFTIVTIILILSSAAWAQTISKITFNGVKNFSESSYLEWSGISVGMKQSSANKDSIKSKILEALLSQGFYSGEVKSIDFQVEDSSKVLINVSISEGMPTLIRDIHVVNPPSNSLFVSKILDDLKGSIFTSTIFESAFSEILVWYENNGFPFALIQIESVSFTADTLKNSSFADFVISINTKQKSRIDIVEIEGNSKTKENVIIRSSQIQLGQEYSQELINNIPDRLNRLRFFEPVAIPEFYFNSKGSGVLKITVKEKETNNFDGIAGYVPSSNENEEGYFTGYININLRNLFGTGRAALIKWQQQNANSQELELRYLEPWIFNYPFNIEVGLFQRKQDSTYVQRNVDAKLEFLATQDISASVVFGSQSTIPTENKSNSFTVFSSSLLSAGFNFRIDTRDDFYSPTNGLFFNSLYKYSSKNIDGPAKYLTPGLITKTSQQRVEFDFLFYKSLFTNQIAVINLHGRELSGSNLELSDLYFLGGANSMRGYREKQFQGNRIIWSNLEYRFLLSRRSFAFAFLDSGYYLRNSNSNNNSDELSEFKYGYGFGLNIETSLGVLGVSFALGKGDSFSDGKIHFGIVNEF